MGTITISTYFSIEYLAVILPATIFLYAILPLFARRLLLLSVSYLFFCAVSGSLIICLTLTTLSVYLLGILLAKIQESTDRKLNTVDTETKAAVKRRAAKNKKLVITAGVLLNIGALAVLKYSPFFIGIINDLMSSFGIASDIHGPSFLLPIGISFYTLQATGYLIDIYRGKISADKNFMRLSLFLSFFPIIMEGPICRYSETAEALWEAPRPTYRNFVLGTQRILYGVMKKLVVADRLNMFIVNVFSNEANYDGFVISVAAVCYTVQLYMDFSGTMDLAVGTGQIFGIRIPENFKRPFFSRSVAEFWKRWHISLGAWFRDYVFYPVSMSKAIVKLNIKARKRFGKHFGKLPSFTITLFCVWICNGLWHGAGWQYVFFGFYHFVLILAGNIIEPASVAITKKLHFSRDKLPFKTAQIIRTCVLVCGGELFFRASDLNIGFLMFKKIFSEFTLMTLNDGYFFELGADGYDYIIVAVVLVIVTVVGILNEKNISIREVAYNKGVLTSFSVTFALIIITVVFGAYGDGYTPVDPIYAAF